MTQFALSSVLKGGALLLLLILIYTGLLTRDRPDGGGYVHLRQSADWI